MPHSQHFLVIFWGISKIAKFRKWLKIAKEPLGRFGIDLHKKYVHCAQMLSDLDLSARIDVSKLFVCKNIIFWNHEFFRFFWKTWIFSLDFAVILRSCWCNSKCSSTGRHDALTSRNRFFEQNYISNQEGLPKDGFKHVVLRLKYKFPQISRIFQFLRESFKDSLRIWTTKFPYKSNSLIVFRVQMLRFWGETFTPSLSKKYSKASKVLPWLHKRAL